MFKLTSNEKVIGTSGLGNIPVPPAALIRAFGPGYQCDGYKVSREWVFASADAVFTLYDYKATSLYSKSAPSPEVFWSRETPERIHIGGNGSACLLLSDFVRFIKEACAAHPKVVEEYLAYGE